MKYKIYKLIDPNTNELMYIGLTTTSLQRRLVSHLHSIFYRDRIYVQKNEWLYNLLLENKIPIIEIVEETDDFSKEKFYINEYRPKMNLQYNKDFTFISSIGHKTYQYDLDGNYLAEYNSISDIEKLLGIGSSNISNVVVNKRNQAGGYMWRNYKEDKINPYTKDIFRKEVHMYTKDGEYIASYRSAREIKGFKYKVISKCCNEKSKTYKGYRFSFEKRERI